MVGGVVKLTPTSRLRGDINILLLGDPGTAKSQLLRWVKHFHPRTVLTSGKGSTAAGLTAAVHRDADQGDSVLDAGALVYADEGICCIDEFDKMDQKDRVAIHEAMEQQTISITKAGIQATLNARASIIAASNPRYGRYDSSKSFAQNSGLPPPLLSRFDLLFTLVDQADATIDRKVASHLTSMHMEADEVQGQTDLTQDELRLYIECAKQVKPLMRARSKRKIANLYVNLRRGDTQPGKERAMRMTVRQLESLIRLSEAVARLKFSDYVQEEHVEEASTIFRHSLFKMNTQKFIQVGETPEQSIKITTDEFQRIALILADRVEELCANDDEMALNGVQVQNLVEWYIETVLMDASESAVTYWSSALWKIIQALINVECVLINVSGDSTDAISQRVAVHPNYCLAAPNPVQSHAHFAYRLIEEAEK